MSSESVPFDLWSAWWQQSTFATALVAGASAGIVTEAVLYPLDTLKTRCQSPRGFRTSGAWRGLYFGVRPALLGCAPASAIFFCTYEASKKALHTTQDETQLPLKLAVSSTVAELAACVARVPTDFIKQRLQTRALLAHPLQELRRALVSGLFLQSFKATACRDICFSGLQFPLYEGLKAWRAEGDPQRPMAVAEAAACGSIAGMCSGFLTTPLDNCKTRLILRDECLAAIGILRAMQETYVQGGLPGLFAGAAARTAWMGLGGCVFLGAYELSKDVLNALSERSAYQPAENHGSSTSRLLRRFDAAKRSIWLHV